MLACGITPLRSWLLSEELFNRNTKIYLDIPGNLGKTMGMFYRDLTMTSDYTVSCLVIPYGRSRKRQTNAHNTHNFETGELCLYMLTGIPRGIGVSKGGCC